jgi:hypothetical protein
MRLIHTFSIAVALAAAVPVARGVAFQAMQGMNMDDRVVPNGGIFVTGWQGKVDSQSAAQGRTINDSRFASEGGGIHLTIGPAAVYWNPANKATGTYTVSAKFVEPNFAADLKLNGHAHPYGLFIAGNNMGTDKETLIYCTAYGDGRSLVRGFSPTAPSGVFQVLRGTNPAVAKAAADGSVTQTIMWSVTDNKAECSINGTVVGTYAKAEIVAPAKLESLEGVYGIRISHNLEVIESGLTMKKQ